VEWQEQSKKLSELLRLWVRPVGVKLVKKEEEEGIEAIRPRKNFGNKITYCQALSIAGRMGLPVLVRGEDEACIMVLPAFGMGRFDPPMKIPESQCAMGWVKDMDTAVKFVSNYADFVLPQGEYSGFYVAPLSDMPVKPDVIMVFGNPFQIVRMVQGYGYVTGEAIESRFTGFSGTCIAGVLATRKLNKPQVVLPGYGDRAVARTEDHELAFAFTPDHMETLLEGIPEVGKRSGNPYPPMKYSLYDTDFTRLNPVYTEFAGYLTLL